MNSWLCIVTFNIITSTGSVAELLIVLLWEEFFPHLGLTNCHNMYEILLASFEAGALRFISTKSDQLVSEKHFSTIKFSFCGRGSLSFVFIDIYTLLHERIALNSSISIYFLNQFQNNSDISYIIYTNQEYKCLFCNCHHGGRIKLIKQWYINIYTVLIVDYMNYY